MQTQSVDILDTADTESTLTTPSFQLGALTTGSIWSGRTSSRHSWVWRHGEGGNQRKKLLAVQAMYSSTKNPQRYAGGSTKHPITHLKLKKMVQCLSR